jgi:hypothetical protein
MKFNFEDSLNKGKTAAELVITNNKEIKAVFDQFRDALSKFIQIEIELKEENEYETNRNDKSTLGLIGRILADSKPTGKTNIFIQNKNGTIRNQLFTIEKNKNGYPISIIFQKDCFVASNQVEVANAIDEISMNPQFHLSLNSFIKKQNIENDKNSDAESQKS